MRIMIYQLVLFIFLPAYLLAQITAPSLPMPDSKTTRKPYASSKERPVNNYANEQTKAYPIDLATSIRLADTNSPLISIAQARVKAAQARQDLANLLQ